MKRGTVIILIARSGYLARKELFAFAQLERISDLFATTPGKVRSIAS